MAQSNYDYTLSRMRSRFLDYDQERMVEKFHLEQEGAFLCLPFLDSVLRVDRRDGSVWQDTDGERRASGFEEAMSAYDLLCCSKEDCRLSGRFSPVNRLTGAFQSGGLGERMFQTDAAFFDRCPEALRSACRLLGGVEAGKGDAAFQLATFPCLPVRLQFWRSDSEFPAALSLLWDENTLDFIHYETTYYVAGALLRRLRELCRQ